MLSPDNTSPVIFPMPDESESEDTAVAAAADDIAAKITKFLIEGFITKTGREPDNKEIEQLFEELTPERC